MRLPAAAFVALVVAMPLGGHAAGSGELTMSIRQRASSAPREASFAQTEDVGQKP